MTVKNFSKLFDHTCLKADATEQDMIKLCKEAADHEFEMVAINPAQTQRCKELLKGTNVHVGAAIGFPLGQTPIAVKVFETQNAIENGADEIDYVINITELKEKNYEYVREEMRQIVEICKKHNVISKVIFENCYLTNEEKEFLCHLALEIKPDFIKTSTGFGTGGAKVEDVKLMKNIVRNQIKVKAAGGIRDLETCLKMVEAGAERIGTSASIKIFGEYSKSRKE